MILRIEDTDQNRFVPGAEEYILDALQWAGIVLDEGPREGGPYGPYRQSERKSTYAEYAKQLVEQGHAYYAFDSPEELEQMRDRLKASGSDNQQYNAQTRASMRNSLSLPPGEVEQLISSSPFVIRFKMPGNENIVVTDVIRGSVNVNSAELDDKILMKADGMPTYHLANVVDDYLMKISHVIRGEEWLPSAPLHVQLYKTLGWDSHKPSFIHLPLLLKPTGEGKLSKRDADQMGFPIFPLDWKDPKTGELTKGYRESGYLPEAIINFLAFLGWNPGTEQEMFSMEELTAAFSIDRIGKAGSKFDIHKAQWYNQQYIRRKPDTELAGYLLGSLKAEGKDCPVEKAAKICSIMKDRVTFPQDFLALGRFFFEAPAIYDEQAVAKKWNDEAVRTIQGFRDSIKSIDVLTADVAKQTLEQVTSSLGIATGKIMQAFRVALTGKSSGPDLMITLEIIGRDETIRRIDHAIHTLTVKQA